MSMTPTTSSLPASRPHRTRGDLNPAQHWLVQIMFEYQFGRIENLRIEGGQPAPDERLSVIRTALLGSKDGGLKVPVSDDPELKKTIWDLLAEIERLRDGYIVRLEFRHGLPFLLETTALSDHLPNLSQR